MSSKGSNGGARWLLGLAGAAVAIGVVVTTVRGTPGPGPLTTIHAGVPELDGGRACAACHGDDSSPEAMAGACAKCHSGTVASIDANDGFHGALDEPGDCARCHREHLGAEVALAGDAAFRVASFAGREGYDHSGLGFTLSGVHATLDCKACHPNADKDRPDMPRYLGASQDCRSCHVDEHEGEMGGDCASCHGQVDPFPRASAFSHTSSFELVGAHASVDCITCHARGTAYAIEAYGIHDLPVRECADCHPSPHHDAFVGAVEGGCAACHVVDLADFLGVDVQVAREAHSATGFALADAHARLECVDCHPTGGTFEERHPGRDANDCAACHADVHGGAFDAQGRPNRCARCHDATSFLAASASFDHRAETGHALSGKHATIACEACHAPVDDRRLGPASASFLNPRVGAEPIRCSTCHTDPHGGAFDRAELPSTVDGRADCARCHDEFSFQGDTAQRFDHPTWTRFELRGAHATLECSVCHAPSEGRRLGPAATSFLDSAPRGIGIRCSTCHADPHQGRFDRADVPARVEGRTDCARCHDESSFRGGTIDRFDHGTWTGFALVGAHAQAECAACHEGDDYGSVPGFERGQSSCTTCHQDPHGDAFGDRVPARVDERDGCARCHDAASFRETRTFDHAWTGWPLDGLHADVACAECHTPRRSGVRLPVLGTDCTDCHGDPHAGQFARSVLEGTKRVTNCARCHQLEHAFDALSFEHAATRFPLDDVHAPLDCAACHKPSRTRDGREVVRYRPLGRECADCHGGAKRRGGGGDDR